VGQFFETYEVQIRDRDGRILDINDEGVLWVKGPSVVSGYFRDEVNTRERFVDGWFNTGDVVRVDRDGYVQIVDRATDIIIVSGFNVYPQEVENALCKHPAVQSAAVVGEKNSMTGEIVKAFVIVKEGKAATEKELVDYCKKNLAHYKVPRRIGFLEEFPVSAAGKILRRELRKIEIDK
jgi:long-chain acyl-CoA synthetase